MREETIETTFRSSDWFASTCDTCCQTDMWVVLLAEDRVCNTCLQNFFDESGDPIDFQQVSHLPNERLAEIVTNDADHSSVRFAAMDEIKRRRAVGVAAVLAMIPIGVIVGLVIYEVAR